MGGVKAILCWDVSGCHCGVLDYKIQRLANG